MASNFTIFTRFNFYHYNLEQLFIQMGTTSYLANLQAVFEATISCFRKLSYQISKMR